ncbi:carbohydrate deacetylase-like [Dendronephthya gigantea]|uniref:carbohydrate deacetylase-like n=1 Tax=Dendronephthya gigantea TaxID=151771 RepID=UPI00106CCEE5|nr:carbohydrate deacetylase-like [Dendronephthya gigantea]
MKPEHSFNSLKGNDLSSSDAPKHEYLIVTADDFGYSMQRDKGIIQAFNNGIITRASLLVNGQTAQTTAVTLAGKHGLPLGLHLNLTEGKPVLENDGSSLMSEGTVYFRGKFGFREALSRGEIDMMHVKDEVEAQIETYIKLVGYPPNHVDGHQHIHICPEIRDTIAQVMISYSLHQIRIPLEPHLASWFDGNTVFYNHIFKEAKTAMDVYNKYQIRYPQAFMGISLMGKHMTTERIIQTYKATRTAAHQRPSVCEFMVHPGYPCFGNQGGCGEGPDEFARSEEREHELNVLCDSELKRILKELGVVFIS